MKGSRIKIHFAGSVVPWWTWLVLGLVLGLILLVVVRMLCASWRGRDEEEKKRQKREESRQRKIERELRKTEERNHKKSVQDTERELREDESEGYDEYHVQNSEYSTVSSELVRGQVAGPSSLLFPTYEQIQDVVHLCRMHSLGMRTDLQFMSDID